MHKYAKIMQKYAWICKQKYANICNKYACISIYMHKICKYMHKICTKCANKYARNMQEYAKKCKNMQVYAGQFVPLKYAKIFKLYAIHMQKHEKYAITICRCKICKNIHPPLCWWLATSVNLNPGPALLTPLATWSSAKWGSYIFLNCQRVAIISLIFFNFPIIFIYWTLINFIMILFIIFH